MFILEDSIVRSTTLLTLITQLRQCGAKEVHVRVSCPPIVSPCFYGIDMSTSGELFAPQFTTADYTGVPTPAMHADMAHALGLNSLRYLSVHDVATALHTTEHTLCTGCITGCYPTPCGQQLAQEAVAAGERAYE